MSDKKPKVAVYCRVGNKDQLCETQPVVNDQGHDYSMLMEALERGKENGYEKVIMLSTDRVVGTVDEVEEIARAFDESGMKLDTPDTERLPSYFFN